MNTPAGNPRSNYLQGDDGNWYNADGERVYYWVPPAETDSTISGDSETQGIGQNLGGYYTESEIKSAWDADEGMGYLKEQTDWDNYWGFVSERQGEIQAGNLVDPIQGNYAGQAKADGVANTDANYQANSGRDEEVYYAQVGANTQLSQQDQMAGWVDQNADLMSKYGIESEVTNDNGDTFKFNGSTYSRTNKVDDHGFYGELGAGLMLGAFGASALAPAIASGLGGIGGSALPAGVAGPSAPLLSSGVTKGLAAGAASAASQGLLTGEIDPGSVLSSAVIAGLNPGGYVADNYAPWMPNGELKFGGAPPSSFYGGLVSGTVNDIVKNGITNGEIDLQGSLEKGLISGGMNSALNTWDEWKGNSQEAIADRLQYTDPTLSRADALEMALSDPLLNTTDFGALIGKDGLFSAIPRADLTFLRNITDPIGDGLSGLLNGFKLDDVMQLPDGTTIPMKGMTDAEYQNYTLNEGGVVVESKTAGLLSNPVVDGAAGLLGKLLPSVNGSLSEDLQAQKDLYDQEFVSQLFTEEDKNKFFDKDGNLTVAGTAAQQDFTQLKMDTLGSFFFENAGGLNENYSWAENPRGQSELWGTMVGVPGLYSTGAEPSWLPNGSPGVVSPPLKPDGTPVTPLNFGPEFTNTSDVTSVDPANAVLPSNNDSAIRNQNFLDYVSLINSGTTSFNDSTNSSTSKEGGDSNKATSSNATTTQNSAGTNTSSTGEIISTGEVTTPDSPEVQTTPVYNLPINDDGTVTLAGGATVPANIADSVTEQMLPDAPSTELAGGSSSTLPGVGGGTLPGLLSSYRGGNDGLPPLWTELFAYRPFRGYTDKRKKLYSEMMNKLGTIEADKGWLTSAFNPRLKELKEAGLIK